MTIASSNVDARKINQETTDHEAASGIGLGSTLSYDASWLQVLEKQHDSNPFTSIESRVGVTPQDDLTGLKPGDELQHNRFKAKVLQYVFPAPGDACAIEGGYGDGENSTITQGIVLTEYWPYWTDDTWFSVDVYARGSWIGSNTNWRVYFKYKPVPSAGVGLNCQIIMAYGRKKKLTNVVASTEVHGGSNGYGVGKNDRLAIWAWKPHITKSSSGAAKEGRIRVYYDYVDRVVYASWQYNGKKTKVRKAQVTITQLNVWAPGTTVIQGAGTGWAITPDFDDDTQYGHIQTCGSSSDYGLNYQGGTVNATLIQGCPATDPPTKSSNSLKNNIDSNGSTACCFDPEANVLMHDNSYKKIKDIVVGDLVKNQSNEINTVLQIETPIVGNRLMYKFNDRFAFVSEEHPLMTTEGWGAFNPDCIVVEEEWKGKLVKIDVGTKLIVMDQSGNLSEELITSVQTEVRDYNYTIYNLMLDGDHTFIVEGVVVHNKKIICTAMNEAYGFGGFRNAIWLDYAKDNLSKHHEVGYHKLALPLLNLAYNRNEKNNMLVRKFLEHIVRHRTADLWMLKKGKMDPLGRIYRIVLEPLVYLLGKILSYKDKK